MNPLGASLLAVSAVSLLSLVGALTLVLGKKTLRAVVPYLISFSAGALLGDTFLHILPEMTEGGALTTELALVFLGGILVFFVLEKWLHFHHSHTTHEEKIHSMVYVAMAGDTLHNFIDGVLIAVSFMADWKLGLATSLAVILHEIPQEIGNFGILLHGGWKPARALLMNFLSALAAFVGVGLVYSLQTDISSHLLWIIALAGANFLYLALSDILPEIQQESRLSASLLHLMSLVLGVGVMYALLLLE